MQDRISTFAIDEEDSGRYQDTEVQPNVSSALEFEIYMNKKSFTTTYRNHRGMRTVWF